jgi:hypothetical protein
LQYFFFQTEIKNDQLTIPLINYLDDKGKLHGHLHEKKSKLKFPDEINEGPPTVFSPSTEKLLLSLLQESNENSNRIESNKNNDESSDAKLLGTFKFSSQKILKRNIQIKKSIKLA